MSAISNEKKLRNLIPFKPGDVGNPRGRPPGSRNKLGEKFLADLLADWQDHGPAVISKVRIEKPDVYLKVVASIVPADVNLNLNSSPVDELTNEELVQRIREIEEQLRPYLEGRLN